MRVIYELQIVNAWNRDLDLVQIRFSRPGGSLDSIRYDSSQTRAELRTLKAEAGAAEARTHTQPASDIRPVEGAPAWIAVDLSGNSIPKGQSAELRFEAVLDGLIFEDNICKGHASFEMPTLWFWEGNLQGMTSLAARVRLPPGITPHEVLSHSDASSGKEVEGDQVLVYWKEERRLTEPLTVGVTFPRASHDGRAPRAASQPALLSPHRPAGASRA